MTVGEFKQFLIDNEVEDTVKLMVAATDTNYEESSLARLTLAQLHQDGLWETVKKGQRVWLPSAVVVTLI